MGPLIEGLRALGAARLFAMASVMACVAGFLTVLIVRGSGHDMALLYGDLDTREAGQIIEQLDAQHIAHTVSPSGNAIMVPAADIGRTRLLLARQGLPSGGSVGYELFDKADGLTATQFQQQITQLRALEGELARTIRTISGVRVARVHLVLPRREPFERDRQEAQASIMLTMSGGARLDREGVQAVLNLVAAAVPGLRPHNVAIVDSRGNLLARAGEPVGAVAEARGLEDVRQAMEARLGREVEDMLERTLGPGRVRAEAAVELDASRLNETRESYNPEEKVERSTQNVTDTSRTSEASPGVSVQNNLPNPDAGQASSGTQSQHQEETTNYEISRTTRTTVREQPEIRRISLAVLVDGVEAIGPDGKTNYSPRSREDMEHIAALVRGAVGYDEKRGDRVEVVNLRFETQDEPPSPESRRLFGMNLPEFDLAHLAQTALLGVLAIACLLFVLRPMVARLSLAAQPTLALAGVSPVGSRGGANAVEHLGGAMADGAAMATSGMAAPRSPNGAALTSATGERMLAIAHDPAGEGGGVEEDAMINVSNVEGQLRASAMRKIAQLVDQHPEESLAIIRGWMQQEAT